MREIQEQGTVVPIAPWLAREGFVAETAVRIDKLEALLKKLAAESRTVRETMTSLQEDSRQAVRIRTFEETLRNARDLKIDEIVRSVRDVRERLAGIEGPRSVFSGLTYRSFDSIDAELKELSGLKSRIERDLYRNAALFAGSLALLATTLAMRFV